MTGRQTVPIRAAAVGVTSVERYEPERQAEWDAFVRASRNGTFLFERAYMEYHRDSFVDCSVVVRSRSGTPLAVMPANRRGDLVESHGGLTYGGLVYGDAATAEAVLAALDAILGWLREEGVRSLRYRAIPYIYHRCPAQEDLYALSRRGGRLLHRAPLSVIELASAPPPQTRRARGVRRASAAGLRCGEHEDLAGYWRLLERVLGETYGAKPVHSLTEMIELRRRFPRQIRLFACHAGDQMVGGVLAYVMPAVARAQYIAASAEGRELAALDLLFDHLRHEAFAGKRFLDLGTSEAAGGSGPNHGVLEFKESLGARLVLQDTWEVTIPPEA